MLPHNATTIWLTFLCFKIVKIEGISYSLLRSSCVIAYKIEVLGALFVILTSLSTISASFLKNSMELSTKTRDLIFKSVAQVLWGTVFQQICEAWKKRERERERESVDKHYLKASSDQ